MPRVLYGAGLATVIVALRLWMYWYYPLLGHDYAAVLPAMYEMRDAFARFGRLDLDFSPFRCLGLPVFAHPNALVWSVYHLAALALPELPGLYVATAAIMTAAYVGCVRLARGLGIRAELATLLAVGWCLQGFCVAHVLAGHVQFAQLALLPSLLWVLVQRRPSRIAVGAVAFWMAHFVYAAGYYLLLTGVPSLLLAAWFLESTLGARLSTLGLGGVRTAFRNCTAAGVVALAMCAPKILAVLDFTALFPRLTHLDRIDAWRALAYTLGQYVVPFRYDVRRFAGWPYGNWESYEVILPGMIVWLAYLLFAYRRELPVRRFVALFVLLVTVGAIVSSGMLAPVFEALPLLASLHVNPRWNAVVLLPFFVLTLAVFAALGPRRPAAPPWLLAAFAAVFVLVPLQFVDKDDMQITYTDRQGIDVARHRLGFCYEPLFGYRLESFPVRGNVDFTADALVDPRCYLRSARCRPGTLFGEPGTREADRDLLLRYALRADDSPGARFTWLALVVYGVGFACALAWVGREAAALLVE